MMMIKIIRSFIILSLVLTARLVWSFEFFLLEARVQLSSKLEETEGGEKIYIL